MKRARRGIISAIVAVLLLGLFSPVTAVAADSYGIIDAGLRAAINQELSKILGQNRADTEGITPEEALLVQNLNASYRNISNLQGITHLKNLEKLDLRGNSLSGTQIGWLDAADLPKLEDLNVSYNDMEDSRNFAGLTNLNKLVAKSSGFENVASLTSLTDLEHLDLEQNAIEGVAPLQNLIKLEFLDISLNGVSDISNIGHLENLVTLRAGHNPINNVSHVMFLSNLKELRLNNIATTNMAVLNPFQQLNGLEYLDLSSNDLMSIDGLRGLTNLEYLDLSFNNISDLSPLAEMTKLTRLDVRWNEIESVSAVSEMKDLEYLDIRNNKLGRLLGLSRGNQPDMRFFYAAGQEVIGTAMLTDAPATRGPISSVGAIPAPFSSQSEGFVRSGPTWTFESPGVKTLDWNHVDPYSAGDDTNSYTGEYLLAVFDGFTDVSTNHGFYEEIGWLNARGITGGYQDGSFRGKNEITREAMAAFIYRAAGAPEFTPPAQSPFEDVGVNNGFYKEITWLAEEEISTGYDDDTFRPKNQITREAMAAFLYRAAGEPDFRAFVSPFSDVDKEDTFFLPIAWMNTRQITGGYEDGTFRPKNQITREATAAFLHRMYLQELL